MAAKKYSHLKQKVTLVLLARRSGEMKTKKKFCYLKRNIETITKINPKLIETVLKREEENMIGLDILTKIIKYS